jgi:hypothetical protein
MATRKQIEQVANMIDDDGTAYPVIVTDFGGELDIEASIDQALALDDERETCDVHRQVFAAIQRQVLRPSSN